MLSPLTSPDQKRRERKSHLSSLRLLCKWLWDGNKVKERTRVSCFEYRIEITLTALVTNYFTKMNGKEGDSIDIRSKCVACTPAKREHKEDNLTLVIRFLSLPSFILSPHSMLDTNAHTITCRMLSGKRQWEPFTQLMGTQSRSQTPCTPNSLRSALTCHRQAGISRML